MATYPHVHSAMIRRDSLTPPDGSTIERRGVNQPVSNVSVRMFQGMASHGYATNYQRVVQYWVEAECRGPSTDTTAGMLVRRKCWSFSGKNAAERADRAYREVLRGLAEAYPGAEATFPTGATVAA